MWKSIYLMLLVYLLRVSCQTLDSNGGDSNEFVLELTDKNFEETVNAKENILVEFYAPWCGHCKTLAPEYNRAAGILAKDGITLAKIDATSNEKMSGKFDVTGYPTLIYFKKSERHEYDGLRTAEGIAEWMRQRSSPSWKPPPSKVLVLTTDNFTDITSNSPLVLVEFYTPWCSHCKQLAPEYDKASTELSRVGIHLAKVDATTEESLKSMFQISGYPTLKIFRKGREYEYKGPRDAQGIIQYMKREATPASKLVNEVKQLENALKDNKEVATVVGFFENDQLKFYAEYEAATNEMRGQHAFFHTFQSTLFQHFEVKSDSIVVFKPELFQSRFENSKYYLDKQDTTSTEIAEFVQKSVIPLVGHRRKSNMQTLYSKRPLVVIYYDVNFSHAHRKATQLIRSQVLKVAKSFPDIRFCISSEEEFQDELKDLGLDDSGEDVNIGYFSQDNLRYPMEPQDGFDSDVLHAFVSSVINGKGKPHFKSQPIPRSNDEPVKVVVANSFTQMVQESEKNVLIEFYAPWCSHCKALEKVYKQLAVNLKGYKNMVVVKMDATANDILPQFQISGFPTIYLVPSNDKQNPILYQEPERNLTSLFNFVVTHIPNENVAKDEL